MKAKLPKTRVAVVSFDTAVKIFGDGSTGI